MRSLLLLIILLCTFSCAQIAVAVGKITVDPNSSPAQAQIQSDKDVRLDQKVTYEARHKAVKNILADLSEMTGVTFNSGYNKLDWQVRDRKMNVFAKDIPLRELMNSISRVMKFKWSVNHEIEPCTYRLYMDRKTLLGADAEYYRSQEAFDKEITRRRENYVDMIENWDDDLPAGELERLKEDNPYLYLLHTRGFGASAKGLFKDVPDLRESFITRERDIINYPVNKLSPETQQAVLNAIKNRYHLIGDPFAGKGEPFPKDAEEAFITTGSLLFDCAPDELGNKAVEHRYFGGFGIYINGRFFQLEANAEPSDPIMQQKAKSDLQVYDKKIPREEVWKQDQAGWAKAVAEESKILEKYFPAESTVEHPDEPALHNKIKLKLDKAKSIQLVDLESALAEASNFAVVSDSFKITNGIAGVSESETELKDVLSAITDGYRYNWEKHGPVIELRNKEWFRKRTTQIPDEWIDRWRANMKKLGYMSIDDYAQIASLTTDQIMENIRTESDFKQMSIFIDGHKENWLLQLYASLSPSDKKVLFSDMGLDVRLLDQDKCTLLRKFLNNPKFDFGKNTCMLYCSVVSRKNEVPVYAFRLLNLEDNREIAQWGLILLKYQSPPKDEPKAAEDKKKG